MANTKEIDFGDGVYRKLKDEYGRAMIAPEFDQGVAYPKGALLTHADVLYRLTAAHTAGTSWGNTSAVQTTFSAEIGSYAIPDADNVVYDNTESGLEAITAQGAIDEISGDIDDILTTLEGKQDTLPVESDGDNIITDGDLTASGTITDGEGNELSTLGKIGLSVVNGMLCMTYNN